MTGETTLKEVIGRLGRAIETLESAAAARLEHEQDYGEAEAEVQTLRKTRDDALTKADKNDAALIGALGGLAQRMEDLAGKLVRKG